MIIKDGKTSHAKDIGPPDFYDGTLSSGGSFHGELGVFLTSGPKKTYDGEIVKGG